MQFIVYGADTYRSQKKLAGLRAKFKADRDPTGLNEVVLRANETTDDQFAEALHSSPFMAERKLVVLEGFCGLNKDRQKKLVELVEAKPDSSVAIFYEPDSKKDLKTSPLFAVLADNAFSEEFVALSADQALGFVAAECAELGLQIDRRAGQLLVQSVGGDSWGLHHEVGKLSAYAKSGGSEMITVEMVGELTQGAVEDSIFDFLDSCTQGQPRQAVALLESMVASGTNELQLLSMLQRQLRTLIGARDLVDRGVTDKAVVAKQLGIHPYPAGKAVLAVQRLSADKLKSGSEELLNIEHRFKTGRGKLKAEIGLFAIQMAS